MQIAALLKCILYYQMFSCAVSFLLLQMQKRKISLIEFQRQCEGKVDSFVSLKERSKQELQGTNDLTISIKWSQLMKFIVQIARGMVNQTQNPCMSSI